MGSVGQPPKGDFDFALFDVRPLRPELLDYAANVSFPSACAAHVPSKDTSIKRVLSFWTAQDVIHLPQLWSVYNRKLNSHWRGRTERETVRRLQSASQVYQGQGTSTGKLCCSCTLAERTPF